MLYKEIISLHSDYIDAYLRLAYLAKKRGDTHRAIEWIDKASKSKAKAPGNQLCQKAKLLFDIGKVNESSLEFRNILERIVSNDSYSFLGLANITFR